MSKDRYNHDVVKQENAKHTYKVTYWDDIEGNWVDLPAKTPGWYPDKRYKCNGIVSKLIETEQDPYSVAATRMREYMKALAEPDEMHPLINDASPHYQLVDGTESIHLMETMFTREELMAWAKITSFKYRFRIGKKSDDAKDIKKMKTYEDYYRYLKEQ